MHQKIYIKMFIAALFVIIEIKNSSVPIRRIDKLWSIYTIETQDATATLNDINNCHKTNVEREKSRPQNSVYCMHPSL